MRTTSPGSWRWSIMTTPCGVHSMGCATRTNCPFCFWFSFFRFIFSGAGQMSQAAGGKIKSREQNAVVAQVNEIAGGHGAGARANVSQRDADDDQQANLSPGAAELLRVRQPKQRAGNQHARGDAEFSGDHRI